MQFNDPTLRFLSNLQPNIASRAVQFINAMRSAGIPAYISSGRRSHMEQASLVSRGASRSLQSKHVDGQAFDIDILGYGRNDLPNWWWLLIGQYGESLGLTWGGRWTTFYDAGHFQV